MDHRILIGVVALLLLCAIAVSDVRYFIRKREARRLKEEKRQRDRAAHNLPPSSSKHGAHAQRPEHAQPERVARHAPGKAPDKAVDRAMDGAMTGMIPGGRRHDSQIQDGSRMGNQTVTGQGRETQAPGTRSGIARHGEAKRMPAHVPTTQQSDRRIVQSRVDEGNAGRLGGMALTPPAPPTPPAPSAPPAPPAPLTRFASSVPSAPSAPIQSAPIQTAPRHGAHIAEQTAAPSAMAGSQTGAAASQTGVPSSRTDSPERIRGRIWGDDIDPQVANSMLGNWPQYHREQVLPGHSASDWPKNQPRGEAVVQGLFDADSSADQVAPHRAGDYAMPSGNESDEQLVPLMVSRTVYAGEMWTPQGNDSADANSNDAFADDVTGDGSDSDIDGNINGDCEHDYGIGMADSRRSAVALNSSNYLANDETAEETIADETTTADAMSSYAPSGNAIVPSAAHGGQATYGIDSRIGSGSAIGAHEDALPNGTSTNDTALMRSGDAAALRIDAHYRLSRLPVDYHVFNDVSLPLEGMALDFDQLVISTSGVFIVSFMPLDGSVYGDGRSPNWAVVPYGSPVTPDEARACAQGVAAAVPQGLQLIANPARRNEWLVDGTARMMGLPADVFHCAVLVPPTARLYLDNAGLAITPTQETGWILSTTPSVLEAEYVADLASALDEYLNG